MSTQSLRGCEYQGSRKDQYLGSDDPKVLVEGDGVSLEELELATLETQLSEQER